MNCARLRQVLDAWLDGELDSATGAEIERHVGSCTSCMALKAGRVALAAQLRAHRPYYPAPVRLGHAVRRSLNESAAARPRRGPTWMQAGAAVTVAAMLSAFVGYWIGRPLPEGSLREQIVASHVASLGISRRLTEIESADRHTVKPWFRGKVDFAPVVRDFSAEGYLLLGGRLDHVADRQTATIVYRVRNHIINLFVWRSATTMDEPLSVAAARGFNVATWSGSGLSFAAISDVDAQEIERFARLVQGGN